jgi:schlafen family protein
MNRAYYSDKIAQFLDKEANEIFGRLAQSASSAGFSLESTQTDAWLEEIRILKGALREYRDAGSLYFEYSIPRLGKRIDVLALIGPVIFVLEFKVGEEKFTSFALDQVCDYALDLKNFHETSHVPAIAPVVIATRAQGAVTTVAFSAHADKVMMPIRASAESLGEVMRRVLDFAQGPDIDATAWEQGRYHPTPTIVEAAMALYNGHSVAEISRNDASAINLTQTSQAIDEIIQTARDGRQKAICFVTGVPGAGKTLVGLNIATKHIDKESELYSVFLSGNDPLVAILREALARDKVRHERDQGRKVKKNSVLSEVKMFIQNVHHFRDECLTDSGPPIEHVALFDEAQRAWTLEHTRNFMLRKKKRAEFDYSEPEFLISCLDRHRDDWAVIVCLVGGGQEINTGEAGISEWIHALNRRFPDWRIYLSSRLNDSEYGAGEVLRRLATRPNVVIRDELHLAVSMRSFRAEDVSLLVKQLLDMETDAARQTLRQVSPRYPIVIARDLREAKRWLKAQARGTERYGIVVSSEAQRLKPHAIDVRSPIDPRHWFLNGKGDVRSSYYLEDVATEFQVQGLELDWVCVTWDGDFRYTTDGWQHWSFRGYKWNRIRSSDRQAYLKNAYRVLLTRARQGMVIVVPSGEINDPTRKSEYYDPTFDYLKSIGFASI